MTLQPDIFDNNLVKLHRARSAKHLYKSDFLIRAASERVLEKFGQEILGEFPDALHIGARHGYIAQGLQGRAGVKNLVEMESVAGFGDRLTAHEEALPYAAGSFNLVTSCLNLHWVNNLPLALVNIHGILKKDGLFLGVMLGGETLREFRESLTTAEITLTGGASPRISPFTLVKDAGRLLQMAGFALPVADADSVTVHYPNLIALLHDLRNMGETNAILERNRKTPPRRLFDMAEMFYREKYLTEDGMLPATFEFISLTGWRD